MCYGGRRCAPIKKRTPSRVAAAAAAAEWLELIESALSARNFFYLRSPSAQPPPPPRAIYGVRAPEANITFGSIEIYFSYYFHRIFSGRCWRHQPIALPSAARQWSHLMQCEFLFYSIKLFAPPPPASRFLVALPHLLPFLCFVCFDVVFCGVFPMARRWVYPISNNSLRIE